MLRQAVRGARWYQHVARGRPSLPRAFSAVAPRSIHFGGPNNKVTFYEQDTRRSKTRRRVDPDAEQRADQKDVENELTRLNEELEALKDPFSPDSHFMRELPEEDRSIALEALRKHAAEEGEEADVNIKDLYDKELDGLFKEEFENMVREEENWQSDGEDKEATKPVVRRPYEVQSEDSDLQPYVDKFNGCLRRIASGDSNMRWEQDLWKWYRRCKQVVPGFLGSMSEETLNLLWDSQAPKGPTKSQETARIRTLAEDAMSAGLSLSTPRILSYIETLHETGDTQAALDQWEAYQADLCQSKEDLEAYWKLGVRLFAAEDDPQRAQDIALAFLANDKSRQPHILIPVITAWGRRSGKEAEVKAWALYLQLKAFLERHMTMDDYDQVSIGFLKAGRLGLAIAVFKDMMVTGDPRHDSTYLYKAAVGLVGNLQASSVSEQDVNKVSLSTLTVLPRKFQNRFFYASWMKKLIGMGEVDSAAMVIELMYERGVKPDAKHLNGVIAAWLRDGSNSAQEKAERLGWAMVQQRIDLVWARANSPEEAPRLDVNAGTESIRMPEFMKRPMPAATIETFSILLLHYTRRSDDDMIRYLVKCLGDARIQPNSYFMNHLLYAELRKQDIGSLWNKYQAMSASTQPDLETYACLWDCGKLQYDRGRTAYVTGFPSARHLFLDMMRWHARLPARGQTTAREEFSKELYDQIIRCFCLSKDLPGTLVALYSMRALFGFFPDDTTARLIVLQVARFAGVPTDTPKRRLRRLSSTPKSKENIGHVNRLVEILSDRKMGALAARGQELDDLEPTEREQYQLEVMAELLRVVMGRAAGDAVSVEGQIAAAAEEMGARQLDLGESLEAGDLLL
ncbi:pentatricopeptide repeat protein [Aspergillus sclerotiicarbonarius CBS 121057]|uniref:Pentatricopeptide repeat protein n=1 Tax=Aspergillus sclerotiicarbonarius (strain CBS 121057 / IBT 28362) TaxID=1448318 RepID=A0A319E7X1_ASPSB|nr:pentatricopeptide repeat protein [Aspergillus sclerotiicarbonarius CBS 121057]